MTDPDRLTEARADTDSGKLRLLADWFDATRPNEPTEVQDDLRRIADDLDAAALRSTPEAGTGDETCPCCQRHCRRSPGFLEHGISLDMDLEVEAEERERGGPPSPLLALAEELEARARKFDEYSNKATINSACSYYADIAVENRYAAQLARDYATREESDDG